MATHRLDDLALLKQKICKEIIIAGATRAFSEFFALTHNEQPTDCQQNVPETELTDSILIEYNTNNPPPEPGDVLKLNEPMLLKLQELLTLGDLCAIQGDFIKSSEMYLELSNTFRLLDASSPNHFRFTTWAPYDSQIVGLTIEPDLVNKQKFLLNPKVGRVQQELQHKKLTISVAIDNFDSFMKGETNMPFDITPLIDNISNEDPIPLSIYYAEKALRVYQNSHETKELGKINFKLGLALLDCGHPIQALIPFSSFLVENLKNKQEAIINLDEINESIIGDIPPYERATFSPDNSTKSTICQYIALESFVRVAIVIIQEIINATNNNTKGQGESNIAICTSPQTQVSKLVAHIGDTETPYGTKIPTNFETLDSTFSPNSSAMKQSPLNTFSPSNLNNMSTNYYERTNTLSSVSIARLSAVLSLLSFCVKMSPFWQLTVTALELTAKTYHLMGRYEEAENTFLTMLTEAQKRDDNVSRACAARALTGAAMFSASRGDLAHAKTLLEERVHLAEQNYMKDTRMDSAIDALSAALSLGFLKSKMNMIEESAKQFSAAWDVALFVGHGSKPMNEVNIEKEDKDKDIVAMDENGQTQLARVGLGIATGIMKEEEAFNDIAADDIF